MSERQRIVVAIAELSAEHGYAAVTVDDVARRAGVSDDAFREAFASREAAFLAAVEAGVEEMLRRARDACDASGGGWEERLRAGLAGLLGFLAERPEVAWACVVEAMTATPASAAAHARMSARFVELLRFAAPADLEPPDNIAEALVGGVSRVVYRQVRDGGASRAMELLPELSSFVVAPYRGGGFVG